MNTLPFSPLPIHPPARAYTPADKTDIKRMFAEFIEQHAPILVCPIIPEPQPQGEDHGIR